ncbi:hypothetical protein [Micromonospora costi]|nr:hypothetical protein [Micromonospora costi]
MTARNPYLKVGATVVGGRDAIPATGFRAVTGSVSETAAAHGPEVR